MISRVFVPATSSGEGPLRAIAVSMGARDPASARSASWNSAYLPAPRAAASALPGLAHRPRPNRRAAA